jgi:hypothetical protein
MCSKSDLVYQNNDYDDTWKKDIYLKTLKDGRKINLANTNNRIKQKNKSKNSRKSDFSSKSRSKS